MAGSPEELLARHPRGEAPHDLAYDHRWPLIQERVQGRTHGVGALADRGRLAAAVTQRRLRCSPPEAGPGVFNETTDEPDPAATAARLVEAIGWHGPLHVEFLRPEDGGRAVLIEVNPRFWRTVELAVRAGVDLPGVTCRLAMGRPPPERKTAEPGVSFAWLLPYPLIALPEGRRGGTGLGAPLDPDVHTDVQFGDWKPHAIHLAGGAARALRHVLRGLPG